MTLCYNAVNYYDVKDINVNSVKSKNMDYRITDSFIHSTDECRESHIGSTGLFLNSISSHHSMYLCETGTACVAQNHSAE